MTKEPIFIDQAFPSATAAGIEGIPPELAARLPGFADLGMPLDELIKAVRQAGPIKGPATPGWPEAMMAYGESAMQRGEVAERAMDSTGAEREFLAASFWFFFARFPHILNPGGALAYIRHNEAYARAAKHFRFPVERISIPFGDGAFPALLRLPQSQSRPVPVVLIWGGIDVWKSDLEIHAQSEKLLERGIATLALDMPGTGEAPIPVSADVERLYRAALDFVAADPRIDRDRIGAYGLSFGGHFAAKLALHIPSLRGVVQVGGPIHHTFAPGHISALPFGTRLALARVMEVAPERFAGAFEGLSLTAQGLLPARNHAPLLSINGELDELVPIADLHWLSKQGVRQDILTFAGDRHVASANRRLHAEFAAAWLAKKLER